MSGDCMDALDLALAQGAEWYAVPFTSTELYPDESGRLTRLRLLTLDKQGSNEVLFRRPWSTPLILEFPSHRRWGILMQQSISMLEGSRVEDIKRLPLGKLTRKVGNEERART
jgi:hypothetical protein